MPTLRKFLKALTLNSTEPVLLDAEKKLQPVALPMQAFSYLSSGTLGPFTNHVSTVAGVGGIAAATGIALVQPGIEGFYEINWVALLVPAADLAAWRRLAFTIDDGSGVIGANKLFQYLVPFWMQTAVGQAPDPVQLQIYAYLGKAHRVTVDLSDAIAQNSGYSATISTRLLYQE